MLKIRCKCLTVVQATFTIWDLFINNNITLNILQLETENVYMYRFWPEICIYGSDSMRNIKTKSVDFM